MTYGFCTLLHLGVNYIMLQSVVKLSESSANAASTTNQFPLSCPVQRSRPQGHVTCCYYFSPRSSQQDTLQMQHVGQLLGKILKSWIDKYLKPAPGYPEMTTRHESIREMTACTPAVIKI